MSNKREINVLLIRIINHVLHVHFLFVAELTGLGNEGNVTDWTEKRWGKVLKYDKQEIERLKPEEWRFKERYKWIYKMMWIERAVVCAKLK